MVRRNVVFWDIDLVKVLVFVIVAVVSAETVVDGLGGVVVALVVVGAQRPKPTEKGGPAPDRGGPRRPYPQGLSSPSGQLRATYLHVKTGTREIPQPCRTTSKT